MSPVPENTTVGGIGAGAGVNVERDRSTAQRDWMARPAHRKRAKASRTAVERRECEPGTIPHQLSFVPCRERMNAFVDGFKLFR